MHIFFWNLSSLGPRRFSFQFLKLMRINATIVADAVRSVFTMP